MIGDLCETQTAECGVSRKRVIGVGLLFWLIARGENRLFSPEEVRPICFCGTILCTVRKADSFQNKSFACGERRIKSKKKSRLAAGDAPVQVATESAFSNYTRNSDSKLFQ